MTKAATTFAHTLDGHPVAIDLEKLIGDGLMAQANAGGGKSGLIRRLMETTYGRGAQHIILDVEDEFYTLREKFSYLLAGGEGADCPATVSNARHLCMTLLETGFNAVIQINGLRLDERREFIREFLEALIGAPRKLWHPALVVLDETDKYAPQKGDSSCSKAVIALQDMGRKRGFVPIFATQRLAKIDKDATGSINNWLMGRVAQTVDRVAVADQLGFKPNSEEGRGLLKLKNREFWGFGPAISLEPIRLRVADIVTTALRPGAAHVPTPPTSKEMRGILDKLAITVEKADAIDPVKLQATIVDLRKQLAAKPAAAPAIASKAPDAKELELARSKAFYAGAESITTQIPAMLDAQHEKSFPQGWRQGKVDCLNVIEPLRAPEVVPGRFAIPAGAMPKAGKPPAAVSSPVESRATQTLAAARAAPPRRGPASGAADPSLGRAKQNILDVMAWWESVGKMVQDKTTIAFLADVSPNSSGHQNNMGALRTAGLIQYSQGGMAELTPAGRAAANPPEAPLDSAALHAAVLAKLNPPMKAILTKLLDGKERSKGELAAELGVSEISSGHQNNLGRLRSLGFIYYPAPGRVAVSDTMFI